MIFFLAVILFFVRFLAGAVLLVPFVFVIFFIDRRLLGDVFAFVVLTEVADGLGGEDLLGVLHALKGELESVEDFAAAFVIHVVLGHGGDDFADGELDGGAIFEDGDVEFMGHEGGVVV